MRNKFLRVLSFFTFPAIVFFVNLFLDYFFDIYSLFPWMDIPMHFLGGVSVGYMSILFLGFFKEENLIEIKNKLVFVLLVVCAVSMIAVLWEFYEFVMVSYFGFNWPLGYEDTLMDLFFGILGGIFAGIVFSKV
ncbi:MAG: hypothetical protein ABIH25_00890 [Candidatus Woesearchaeota archaeon]